MTKYVIFFPNIFEFPKIALGLKGSISSSRDDCIERYRHMILAVGMLKK